MRTTHLQVLTKNYNASGIFVWKFNVLLRLVSNDFTWAKKCFQFFLNEPSAHQRRHNKRGNKIYVFIILCC